MSVRITPSYEVPAVDFVLPRQSGEDLAFSLPRLDFIDRDKSDALDAWIDEHKRAREYELNMKIIELIAPKKIADVLRKEPIGIVKQVMDTVSEKSNMTLGEYLASIGS